jgi:hypothetical protein
MNGMVALWMTIVRLGLGGTAAAVVGCNASNSEVPDDGSSGTSGSATGGSSAAGGTSAGGGGSGGSPGTGGHSGSSATGGQAGSVSSGGSTQGGTGGDGACPSRTNLTVGTHMMLNVTWPSTLATSAGSGVVHIWEMRRIDVSGTNYTGDIVACGNVLPPVKLSALAGGGSFQIEIPDESWDLPTMPAFPTTGTIAGFSAGSAFTGDAQTALIGLTLEPPDGDWPSVGAITSADHDGDMKPGITSFPRTDMGFVRPPTSIAGQVGDVADEIYLVTRLTAGLSGSFTSCTDLEGTAEVTQFDNHVVGCNVFEGETCDDGQADFIDANRTIFEVADATFESKLLGDAATCADVRAALPQ